MKVKDLLISKIKKKKFINLDEFINLSLFSDHGYYSKKNPIGSKSDFITAPEISQMFGEILGLYILNFWDKKINSEFNLIELGPGKGSLIKDILRIAQFNDKFKEKINLFLIEKNQKLKSIQKSVLKSNDLKKIRWFKNFKINNNFPSIIFSNEFFDCFPIRQFYKKKIWLEKFIEYNEKEDKFRFIDKQVKDSNLLKKLNKFNKIGVAEISETREKYYGKLCKFLRKNKGIFITIDYGYLDPIKNFSLQTLHNHNNSHLFDNLGEQDITSLVDFRNLVDIAKKNKLMIDEFSYQKDFLLRNGIEIRKNKLQKNKNIKTKQNLENDFNRLVNDQDMGKKFKVLIASCL